MGLGTEGRLSQGAGVNLGGSRRGLMPSDRHGPLWTRMAALTGRWTELLLRRMDTGRAVADKRIKIVADEEGILPQRSAAGGTSTDGGIP